MNKAQKKLTLAALAIFVVTSAVAIVDQFHELQLLGFIYFVLTIVYLGLFFVLKQPKEN